VEYGTTRAIERRRVRIRRVVCLVRFWPMREGRSSNRRLQVGKETSGGDARVLEDVSPVSTGMEIIWWDVSIGIVVICLREGYSWRT
jgi:hypothetical protein